jgi:CBS domain-containing protein
MTMAVQSCTPSDNLQRAAELLWQRDCGVVPVVDTESRVVGMITDRDICMAAYTQGRQLWQIPVSSAMGQNVQTANENDSIQDVETLMRKSQVRRVPVVDGTGRLKGILSLNDLARHVHKTFARKSDGLSGDSVAQTLAAIGEPRKTAQQSAA